MSKNKANGFTVEQFLGFAKSINKKAQKNSEYKRVIDVANSKWNSYCGI